MASPSSLRNAALRARAMLEGISEPPAWLEAFERFGSEEISKGKSPKQLNFPEDRLYQAYIHKNPEFRQQPLDLNSENPSPMKLFVLAQAALIEKGHSRKKAYNLVEAEFSKAMAGSSLSAGQTALTAAQKQEETLLQNSLKQQRAVYGSPANLESESFSFRLPPRHSQQSTESQQQNQFSPLGFQPRNSMPQAGAASGWVSEAQSGSVGQAYTREQRPQASSSKQDKNETPISFQGQHSAPAGFVQFGVEPKGPP